MECAGRALSFWAYQSTQEMFGGQEIPCQEFADYWQYVPRISGEESDGQICILEHANG